MKWTTDGKTFVVYRGTAPQFAYFSFYVDGYSSSWTKYKSHAAHFATQVDAEIAIARLKERVRMKRKQGESK